VRWRRTNGSRKSRDREAIVTRMGSGNRSVAVSLAPAGIRWFARHAEFDLSRILQTGRLSRTSPSGARSATNQGFTREDYQ